MVSTWGGGALLANNLRSVLGYPFDDDNLYKSHSDIACRGAHFGRLSHTHAVDVETG